MSGSFQPAAIPAEIAQRDRSLALEPSADPHLLAAFDHQPRTRIVFGVDAVHRVGELCKEIGGRRILLVTDSGIVQAGHSDVVVEHLRKANLTVSVFSGVQENPGTQCIEACVAAAREANVDLIVAVGGGSSMDTAKGCNFILTNGGKMRDYWGVGKATKPMLPLVAIPTTAGTGSECQSFALISDENTHQKMACGDPKAAARIAILDPALTLSQPFRVTACTGIDAIAHAVETAVTKRRSALSLLYSHAAFKLCVTSFPKVLEFPDDLESRGKMLLGAALAGMAIENSMLGAAHSAANPLTAHFGIVHGEAVGMMLPHVIRFNAIDQSAALAYAELASAPELACVTDGFERAVDALVSRIEMLLDLAKFPKRLRERGVTESIIPQLASEAAQQWTANFNPRSVTTAEFEQLFRRAL
jgi:alcohol dehydrogenase